MGDIGDGNLKFTGHMNLLLGSASSVLCREKRPTKTHHIRDNAEELLRRDGDGDSQVPASICEHLSLHSVFSRGFPC